jgi:ferredoxin-type protein NapF
MSRRLRGLRRGSQLVFFAAFVALFGLAATVAPTSVPPDLFLRSDPLIALSGMASLRRLLLPLLWFALPVVALSLALGRAYCGWVCPMGTALDLGERLLHLRGRRPSQAPPWRRVKFYLLLALLVTILLPAARRSADELSLSQTVGLSAVYLLDPIALLTRTFTLVLLPAVQWVLGFTSDQLTAFSYSDLLDRHLWLARVVNPVQGAVGYVAGPAYFRLGLFSFAFFLGIIALGSIARRFWCRNLCPLGALLGFLGKASPVRLAVSEKCTRCLRCVNECKTGAITEDPHRYRGPECIACFTCVAICPEKAISLTVRRADADRDDALQLDRRRVLQAAGLGVAALVLPKVDWTGRFDERKVTKFASDKLIRPPGALPEEPFVTACVRCGECMKICPTNALQPALGEGGLQALGTPIVVPRIGPCAQACNLCGQVCPTRAIEPFTIEEKDHLYLGTAMVDRSLCIAWAADKQCLICDEACSYRAISQKTTEGVGRPVIDEHVCVGCGLCERACPIQPQAAIHVYASGDKRHLSRVEQAAWRQQAQQEPAGESPYSQQAGREGPG